ncbi:MAG: hypothetical protein M5U28_54890 [Sandaracinaceae bacterium]|nr:hypothetical protein [Sandaracinaceae bacterium]
MSAVHAPPPIDGIEARLTHPCCASSCWRSRGSSAMADGRIHDAESALFAELAERLSVGVDRARGDPRGDRPAAHLIAGQRRAMARTMAA